ncbi:MAG TPA: alanine racemase [bacterium]|nr:alanine racemase [bacterium]
MNSEAKTLQALNAELTSVLAESLPTSAPDAFTGAIRRLNRPMFLESIRRFGSPHYLLQTDDLLDRGTLFLQAVRKRFPSARCYYALKCNDLPAVAAHLRSIGYGADVAGLYELQLALKLGFNRIVFNSPGKTDEELRLTLQHPGKVILIIDNSDEIDRLAALCAETPPETPLTVGLRLAVSRRIDNPWQKFGFVPEQVPDAIRRLDDLPGIRWRGLHFHSSWNKTPLKYFQAVQVVGRLLEKHLSPAQRESIRFLDIGGGFYPEDQAMLHHGEDKGLLADMIVRRQGGRRRVNRILDHDPHAFRVMDVDPLDTYMDTIAGAIATHIRPRAPHAELFLEPGRFIVSHSTSILMRVLAVKNGSVVVDGGINMLGDYKFSEYSFAPLVNLTRPSETLHRCTVFGPLCDPSDLWGYAVYGEPLRPGDAVAVLHQGAYTFSTAWRFIKAIPPYIALSGGDFRVVKAAESFEDRYSGCVFN